jgi:hypothetical protein
MVIPYLSNDISVCDSIKPSKHTCTCADTRSKMGVVLFAWAPEYRRRSHSEMMSPDECRVFSVRLSRNFASITSMASPDYELTA